jgi:L-alanine-DL-glutamate epimerase-like enolase superfamily enzyme
MAVHMAETPVAALAAVHSVAATENFLACENHSVDIPWWDDIVVGTGGNLVKNGFIEVSDRPGLGIEDLNDEVLREHADPERPELWASTEEWNKNWSHDRTWS